MNVKKLKDVWLEFFRTNRLDDHWWARKQCVNKERQADIVKIRGQGRFYRKLHYDQKIWYEYLLHLTYVTKQNKQIYKEEQDRKSTRLNSSHVAISYAAICL